MTKILRSNALRESWVPSLWRLAALTDVFNNTKKPRSKKEQATETACRHRDENGNASSMPTRKPENRSR